MPERNSEQLPVAEMAPTSRLANFLGRIATARREVRTQVDELQHERVREHYWQLRSKEGIAVAEQFLMSHSTSVSDAISCGEPVLLGTDYAGAPKMDARGRDFSMLSDEALSIAVADRTYGFFSIEDLTPEDRMRVIDITNLGERERRTAIRELLLSTSSDETQGQKRLRDEYVKRGPRGFVRVRSPEVPFPTVNQ